MAKVHPKQRKVVSAPDFRSLQREIQLKEARGSFKNFKELVRGNIEISKNDTNGVCPHKYHCIQNALLKGFLRTFSSAYLTKSIIQAALALFGGRIRMFGLDKKGRNLGEQLAAIFLNPDHARFAFWLALMAAGYRGLVCYLRRRYKKDEKWMHVLAGFICAAFIRLDSESRTKSIALYMTFRALGDLSVKKSGEGKLPNIPYAKVWGFALANMVIIYACTHKHTTVDRKYKNWIYNFAELSAEKVTLWYDSKTYQSCQELGIHSGSCTEFTLRFFLRMFRRSVGMYFPVHFLPPLLFNPVSVVNDPVKYLVWKSWNCLRSAFFLAVYGVGYKRTNCYLRNSFKENYRFIAPVSGFCAGLSLFVEHPNRHLELVLYVIPKAVEIILRLANIEVFKRREFSMVCFQISIAAWMYIRNSSNGDECCNSLNRTILKVIFGTPTEV